MSEVSGGKRGGSNTSARGRRTGKKPTKPKKPKKPQTIEEFYGIPF